MNVPRSVIWRWALAVAVVSMVVANTPAHAVTIDWVTVGDPGNANDGTGYGAVAYSYQIGKYDVTIQQYKDFLNAVAATDTYGLYNTQMASDLNIAGISRAGSSGSYTYHVIGPSGTTYTGASSPGNRPITYVDWFNAARFANWLSNGRPTGPQGPTTTENGAYDISFWILGIAPAVNATNPNTGAAPLYRLPTENEWYKAAYYSPTLNSGSGGYYTYATQSNSAPGNVVGSGANQANYFNGVYSVTQSGDYDSNQNYLTDVGAFTTSASFYGTFDQSGNVFQWNDLDGSAGSSRGLRGGGWDIRDAVGLSSSSRGTSAPSGEGSLGGFRLASPVAVPEPSTWVMGLAGIACAGWGAYRRRRAR